MFADEKENVEILKEILCSKDFSIIFAAGLPQARMAELVDALDSKSSDSNIVPVRFRLRVQKSKPLQSDGYKGFLFDWKKGNFAKTLEQIKSDY